MIIWVIAGLLALATGMRIGWALVNRQSVVTSAMTVALAGLAALAALNWPPLTRLVNSALGWPNIAVALSGVVLVAAAAGSSVMITSVASGRGTPAARRFAAAQYGIAAVVAAAIMVSFLATERRPETVPGEYLAWYSQSGVAAGWVLPVLYVVVTLSTVSWMGLRMSTPSRRGRALFFFAAGIALIVTAAAVFGLRAALNDSPQAGRGAAVALLACALFIVAAGALLPPVADWAEARRERRMIEPLRREMQRRQPDVGIGVRPRGPLVYQVAEQLSVISDSLYLEAVAARAGESADGAVPASVTPGEQAEAVARWIQAGPDGVVTAFPGNAWLRQPAAFSDREWILEIARRFRRLAQSPAGAGVAGVRPGVSAS